MKTFILSKNTLAILITTSVYLLATSRTTAQNENGTEWQTWKTIKVGTPKSVREIRKSFKENGCKFIKWKNANNKILRNIVRNANGKEDSVNFAVVSVAELGFEDGAKLQTIYNRATELGLELCSAEDGLALRKQYKKQPVGEVLHMAMPPIKVKLYYFIFFGGIDADDIVIELGRDSGTVVQSFSPYVEGTDLYIFSFERPVKYDACWLGFNINGDPEKSFRIWGANELFVFRIPKNKSVPSFF